MIYTSNLPQLGAALLGTVIKNAKLPNYSPSTKAASTTAEASSPTTAAAEVEAAHEAETSSSDASIPTASSRRSADPGAGRDSSPPQADSSKVEGVATDQLLREEAAVFASDLASSTDAWLDAMPSSAHTGTSNRSNSNKSNNSGSSTSSNAKSSSSSRDGLAMQPDTNSTLHAPAVGAAQGVSTAKSAAAETSGRVLDNSAAANAAAGTRQAAAAADDALADILEHPLFGPATVKAPSPPFGGEGASEGASLSNVEGAMQDADLDAEQASAANLQVR